MPANQTTQATTRMTSYHTRLEGHSTVTMDDIGVADGIANSSLAGAVENVSRKLLAFTRRQLQSYINSKAMFHRDKRPQSTLAASPAHPMQTELAESDVRDATKDVENTIETVKQFLNPADQSWDEVLMMKSKLFRALELFDYAYDCALMSRGLAMLRIEMLEKRSLARRPLYARYSTS